jgi:hypothetical protein
MQSLTSMNAVVPPRRFVLLPEEPAIESVDGPLIRRYSLASLGVRSADGLGFGSRRLTGELSRIGRIGW